MTRYVPGAAGFFRMLERIERGTLRLTTPDGALRVFGAGGPGVDMHIRDWRTLRALAWRGEVGMGESYAEGWWDTPDLEALATLSMLNADVSRAPLGGALLQRLSFLFANRVLRRNSRSGARRNIHAHYDLGNEFYGRWLDGTMTYSSALFADAAEPLERAQARKYDRLLDKVVNSGPRTLEIGCGWGGFAERAAQAGRDVTSITISRAQHDYAARRLGSAAKVRLQDYRDVGGTFDAIVSIEMIEAVGERYWPGFFRTIKERLAPGGRAALQAIIVEDESFDHYRSRTDFIRQYTFPGGMLICPRAIARGAAQAGLVAGGLFRFGQDYARTLRHWSARFAAARPELADRGFAPQFLRGWQFYLDTCAAGFAARRDIDVVQFELRHA